MNVCSLSPERLAELKTRIKQKNKNKTHKYKRIKLPYKQHAVKLSDKQQTKKNI